MKILFLGGNLSKALVDWLETQGEIVIYTTEKITLDYVKKIGSKFMVSYNYKYLIQEEIIDYVHAKVINLHISFLPYSRGAYPNIWSFLEDTPKGVTIHYVDEKIDTGDIIVQKQIFMDENNETLKSYYEILHREIQKLFKKNWSKIKKSEIAPFPQIGKGTFHIKNDFSKFEPFIKEKGWNTTIMELKEQYSKHFIAT